MFKTFVVFVIALQKPEHAGVDTPNRNQSKLKLESVKHRGVQVTGLPSKFLSWFSPFCCLCCLLGFLTVTALTCSCGPMPLVHVHVLTTEGRNRVGSGCHGAPEENMWICFPVGPFCKLFHFFQKDWSPSCFCVDTQWSKHSPNCVGFALLNYAAPNNVAQEVLTVFKLRACQGWILLHDSF